jgi:hypothetical protein
MQRGKYLQFSFFCLCCKLIRIRAQNCQAICRSRCGACLHCRNLLRGPVHRRQHEPCKDRCCRPCILGFHWNVDSISISAWRGDRRGLYVQSRLLYHPPRAVAVKTKGLGSSIHLGIQGNNRAYNPRILFFESIGRHGSLIPHPDGSGRAHGRA